MFCIMRRHNICLSECTIYLQYLAKCHNRYTDLVFTTNLFDLCNLSLQDIHKTANSYVTFAFDR